MFNRISLGAETAKSAACRVSPSTPIQCGQADQLTKCFSLFLGVYDTGLIRIKKHDDDGPHQSSTLLFPATNQSIPLIRELESLFSVSPSDAAHPSETT